MISGDRLKYIYEVNLWNMFFLSLEGQLHEVTMCSNSLGGDHELFRRD